MIVPRVMDTPQDQLRNIRRMVYRLAPSWIDRESLIMDIWIQCWTSQHEPSLLVVRHRLVDLLRREHVRRHLPLHPDIPDTKPSPGNEHLKVAHLIDEAQLSFREKHIIFLRYYEDLSFSEISLQLDVTLERIRQIHEASLRKLRGASYR